MNTEKLDKVIALLTALREGKTLQFNKMFLNTTTNQTHNDWTDINRPPISTEELTHLVKLSERYRVKPEPREWWILRNTNSEEVFLVTELEQYAKDKFAYYPKEYTEIIHLIEVL